MREQESPISDRQSRQNQWWLFGLISLIIHAVLLSFALIFFKGIAFEKGPPSANVVFKEKANTKTPSDEGQKPILTLDFKPVKKPQDAKYYAEKDQESLREQQSRNKSLDPRILSDRPEIKKVLEAKLRQEVKIEALEKKAAKELAHQGKRALSIDDFIEPSKEKALDPLGIRIKPGNSMRNAMPFSDQIDDVAEGERTEINTWQWRHAEFFNRIKRNISRYWEPNTQIARFDPEGSLLGQRDRVTVMLVTIDEEGQLKSLSIATSSGVFYLDDEAERAFKQAAPFPFPPRALFKAKDEFSFKFAFHLQMNRGVSLNFDWNAN